MRKLSDKAAEAGIQLMKKHMSKDLRDLCSVLITESCQGRNESKASPNTSAFPQDNLKDT
jgi:hypothetical protein